jgi:nucleoside-diphosphate-sugar epimerase
MLKPPKILITGANGQLGTVMAARLREIYGKDNILTTDIQKSDSMSEGPFEFLDILNTVRLHELVGDYKITQVYHLAAILSASGEYNPLKTWKINLDGFITILELCRNLKLDKVFFPSTIAVFGKTTPRVATPQDVPLLPETVYGISKTSGELLANYYHKKYGIDVRSLRYPGIISYQSPPGGGTTDYAVEIFYEALKHGKYECFLEADTRLPMMYIFDSLRATIELMQAPKDSIKTRYAYNLAAVSFTPAELAEEIKKHIPEFEISYNPDFRQEIASSWTESIDDSRARQEWGWKHEYGLKDIVADMLLNLKNKV